MFSGTLYMAMREIITMILLLTSSFSDFTSLLEFLSLLKEIFPLADIVIPLDYIPSWFMQLTMQLVPEDAFIVAFSHAALFKNCTTSPKHRDSCVWWSTEVLGMAIISIATALTTA